MAITVIVVVSVILGTVAMAVIFPKSYKNQIALCAKRNNIDENLVYGIVFCESGFDCFATSRKGAVGLMQLMPSTAKWCCERLNIEYNEQKLFEPDYNLTLGIYYLSYLANRFDTQQKIVWAYNAGETKVKTWSDRSQVYKETLAYERRVVLVKKIYELLY